MRFFLKINSGFLFLLLFVFPVFLVIVVNRFFFFGANWADVILGVYLGSYYSIFIAWIISISSYFNKKLKLLSTREYTRFKVSIYGAVLYGLYLTSPVSFKLAGNVGMFVLTPIIFVIGTFSLIYLLYCAAKTLQTIQLGNKITTGDIVIHMILFMALPISVWWIQKRINNYYLDD